MRDDGNPARERTWCGWNLGGICGCVEMECVVPVSKRPWSQPALLLVDPSLGGCVQTAQGRGHPSSAWLGCSRQVSKQLEREEAWLTEDWLSKLHSRSILFLACTTLEQILPRGRSPWPGLCI